MQRVQGVAGAAAFSVSQSLWAIPWGSWERTGEIASDAMAPWLAAPALVWLFSSCGLWSVDFLVESGDVICSRENSACEILQR